IRKLKIWKELKRLETRVRENPVPATYVDLGQVYINLGMNDRTLELAEEGLALFPRSEELRKLRRFAKKTQVSSRIKDLCVRLDRGPQPKLYRELANLYLEQGDHDAVQRTCEECVRHFPDDEGALLVLAKARLTSFYRDLSASDGLDAVDYLQKVIALDPEHVRAHKMLAEVLYRVGAAPSALQHLDILGNLVPDDQDVARMVEDAQRASPFEEDLETLFQRVEDEGGMATSPVRGDAERSREALPDRSTLNRVRDSLAQIADFAGVRKAAYIRGSKALVKGDIKDGKDAFLRVARVVAKASQRSARRMDIGNFNKGVLEGSFGRICLCSYGEVVAAVLCDPGTDVDRVLAELQELVAGSLYLTGA
ncbi:MAG: tetratricopeptide repeat protein, partial [Phycisphaerales bacterium]|nr:tetratricopeptide repeat protein [Phycisphaerales bacterium]